MFINGIGSISSQNTSDGIVIPVAKEQKLYAVEPDYSQWIEPRLLRRMSRIVSMGVTAGLITLKDAGIDNPDAIVTGTGYGCLEDTGIFLTKMAVQKEEGTNPTPFIQSTHNTIGSQLALLLKCHGHNQTFTHMSFSLESAILDAGMLLTENPGQNILVGAVDEITEDSHLLMQRSGIIRNGVHGEGAFYFLCSDKSLSQTYARIAGCRTFYKPESVESMIIGFLNQQGVDPSNLDVVLFGGMDDPWDREANKAVESVFAKCNVMRYKKYSGEFATSAGFAVWMGARIVKDGYKNLNLPNTGENQPSTVLIYNPYLGNYHSLILLQSCRDIK